MRHTIRNLFAAGIVIGACAISSPAAAQGNSHKGDKAEVKAEKRYDKAVEKRRDQVVNHTTYRRPYTHARVLCADGVWVTRVTNACINRGGLAARQGNYTTTPRASARARERAALNSAVRRNTSPYANHTSTYAIARCMDGLYWHSTVRTNACSSHGGVARWL